MSNQSGSNINTNALAGLEIEILGYFLAIPNLNKLRHQKPALKLILSQFIFRRPRSFLRFLVQRPEKAFIAMPGWNLKGWLLLSWIQTPKNLVFSVYKILHTLHQCKSLCKWNDMKNIMECYGKEQKKVWSHHVNLDYCFICCVSNMIWIISLESQCLGFFSKLVQLLFSLCIPQHMRNRSLKEGEGSVSFHYWSIRQELNQSTL